MKKSFLLIPIFCISSFICSAQIIKIKLSDGDTLTGKLFLPTQDEIKELIILIPGTGPNTYMNHRKFGNYDFNYVDLFAEQFNKRGIALFTYNRRGVDLGEDAPYFDKIDREKYKKYLPVTEAIDIETVIKKLKKNKQLKKAPIILYGISEGTMIASIVADRQKVNINGLFLQGYAHDNLSDIIKWQFSGASSIINLKSFFDKNNDNIFTREEYTDTSKIATYGRQQILRNARFDDLDLDKDGVISQKDFGLLNHTTYEKLLSAITNNDDEYIWNNYFRVTSAWLKEHFALETNKTRLPRLNIPIYIFHGDSDANTPVEKVYEIKNEFERLHKENLHVFIFKGHNHDLNYMNYIYYKQIPEGLQKIFDTAEALKK